MQTVIHAETDEVPPFVVNRIGMQIEEAKSKQSRDAEALLRSVKFIEPVDTAIVQWQEYIALKQRIAERRFNAEISK